MDDGGNGAHHIPLLVKYKTTYLRETDPFKNLIFPVKGSASVNEVTLGRARKGVRDRSMLTQDLLRLTALKEDAFHLQWASLQLPSPSSPDIQTFIFNLHQRAELLKEFYPKEF